MRQLTARAWQAAETRELLRLQAIVGLVALHPPVATGSNE